MGIGWHNKKRLNKKLKKRRIKKTNQGKSER